MLNTTAHHHNRQLSIYTHLLPFGYWTQASDAIILIKIHKGAIWTNPDMSPLNMTTTVSVFLFTWLTEEAFSHVIFPTQHCNMWWAIGPLRLHSQIGKHMVQEAVPVTCTNKKTDGPIASADLMTAGKLALQQSGSITHTSAHWVPSQRKFIPQPIRFVMSNHTVSMSKPAEQLES